MTLPLPVADGLSLLVACRTPAEVVAQLAAWLLESDALETARDADWLLFVRDCARELPPEESALVAEVALAEVWREAVRQLRERRDADLALVRDARVWLRAAVAGEDALAEQDPAVALAARRHRLRTLVRSGEQAEALDARADAQLHRLMKEPPGGRDLHPEFWPGDRGRDGSRNGPQKRP